MEEKKEYKLRQVLESLISAYYENERKLGELAFLTCVRTPKVDQVGYYIQKSTNRAPELMLQYYKEKNFLARAIAKVLEALNLYYEKRNVILCTINNNGEYVMKDGIYIFDTLPEFKKIATDILYSEFANNMDGNFYSSEKRLSLNIWPGAFAIGIVPQLPKCLNISYQSHSNELTLKPNGLNDEELENLMTSYSLSSEYFNEYQRRTIESGADKIGIQTVNYALEKAHKRIRSKN